MITGTYSTLRNASKNQESVLKQTVSLVRLSSDAEMMGYMAAGLAHDLNNMLHGAVGALDLMQMRIDQERTDEIADLLHIALGSLRRTAALIDNFTAFWRPRPAELKQTCVNTVIESMNGLLRCTLGDEIEIEFGLAKGLPSILCDPHQLENALLNMAVNARAAMPCGGRLVVRTFCAHRDAGQTDTTRRPCIEICITDTGIGMMPDVAEHAFEPFYTTKPGGRGTGLGLAMVKSFVDQFAGEVKLKSAIGEGTTITLCLPAR
jgi:signal transduction histidine kinase